MSSTPYIAIDNESTATSEGRTNTLEEDPLLPSTVDPYLPQQHWSYLQYLIPLIVIFVFPLTFASFVSTRGRVPAPQKLAKLGMAYPQVKGQIVAILATSLTTTTRWALGGAAALLARKRLLRPRPVYEIDMFFRLTNISVVWDWKHRRRMMFLTWLLVALCGLLTSGFFTLLNPLIMEVHTPYPSAREINIAANSDLWENWYNTTGSKHLVGSYGTRTAYYASSAPSFLQSMTRQYLASKKWGNGYSIGSFVTTSIEFDTQATHWESLNLQGTWIDVSCSTGTAPPLSVTYDHTPEGYANYNFTCPGASTLKKEKARILGTVIAALYCPLEDGTTANFFKQLTSTVFTSVENITCIASPQIGDVNALLNPQIHAFDITGKSAPIPSFPPVVRRLTNLILEHVTRHFQQMPIFFYILQAWQALENEGHLTERTIEEMVEMILSALFELEASYARLNLMQASRNLTNPPPEAIREVNVKLIENTIGWEVKWTTWLGLLPLVTICIITFTMLAMAWWSAGGLTVFDPMSPVSLLGATSVGEVVLPNQGLGKTIGAPLDENVLTTRVSYTKKNETWGLWSSEGKVEGDIKGSI